MTDLLPLGIGAWAFIATYLLSLIGIGWYARLARQGDTLQDFYLAGRGFGFGVLFLTLFATQYSGNTFFAFTGATYRIGYAWILSLHFMTTVVIAYLSFAPALHQRARERHYLTPADYIRDRFESDALALLVTVIMLAVLCNFLLAQLMAMGRAMQGLAHDAGGTAYTGGVIVLETINPASLSALRNYFADLTHAQPLVPQTLAFLVETAGFHDVEVELRSPLPDEQRLRELPHPDGTPPELVEASTHNVSRLNDLLFAPQDYAVIARA